jgi:hypothetical protein
MSNALNLAAALLAVKFSPLKWMERGVRKGIDHFPVGGLSGYGGLAPNLESRICPIRRITAAT